MTETTETTDLRKPCGWVFYDAQCNFCVRRARQIAGIVERVGYAMVPFQTDWVAARLGRRVDEAPTEMVVLTRDGAVIGGTDALLHLARLNRWTRVLSAPARLPVIKQVLDLFYRTVARHRYRLWGRCAIASLKGGRS